MTTQSYGEKLQRLHHLQNNSNDFGAQSLQLHVLFHARMFSSAWPVGTVVRALDL